MKNPPKPFAALTLSVAFTESQAVAIRDLARVERVPLGVAVRFLVDTGIVARAINAAKGGAK